MSRRESLRNAGIFLASMVVALALAELAVRLLIPVRDVGPAFSIHDAVLGKRLKANFSAERITPEFRMRLTTNSLGFRGQEPGAIQRESILFLGDSFTLGYGVSDGEEFPARVAAALRQRYGGAGPPVLNAGIGDSGNGFWVKFLRGEAGRLRPRIVVVQLFDNDFRDNVDERLFTLESSGALRELPVPGPSWQRSLQSAIEALPGAPQSYLVGLLRQVLAAPRRAPAQPHPAEPLGTRKLEPDDALTLRIVEEAISICDARGWQVLGLVVGLPAARAAAIRDVFERHRAPTLMIPAKRERPDLYFAIDGHWHSAGHVFAANRVVEALDALGVGKPR
jgi:hypothetical protein